MRGLVNPEIHCMRFRLRILINRSIKLFTSFFEKGGEQDVWIDAVSIDIYLFFFLGEITMLKSYEALRSWTH